MPQAINVFKLRLHLLRDNNKVGRYSEGLLKRMTGNSNVNRPHNYHHHNKYDQAMEEKKSLLGQAVIPFPDMHIALKNCTESHSSPLYRSKTAKPTMKLLQKFHSLRNIKSTLRSNKGKDHDHSTVSTDDYSEGSLFSSPVEVKEKEPLVENKASTGVRFALTSDGNVLCEVRKFRKSKNPGLWWQEDEVEALQNACLEVIDNNREGPDCIEGATVRFIEKGWKEDGQRSRDLLSKMRADPSIRGLERHVIQRYDNMMSRHINNVLEIQKTSKNELLLRLASRQTSQPWVELAVIRAQHDAAILRRQKSRRKLDVL